MAFEITPGELHALFGSYGHASVIVVLEQDDIVQEFVLRCEQRIMKHFKLLGLPLTIPEDLPELRHVPRRLRSIWD